MDPLFEKHFSFTPYAYVYNNPIKFIDPFGLDSSYFSESGRLLNQTTGDQGESDHRYLVRTTKTTDAFYNPEATQKGKSNPISRKEARHTKRLIRKGNFDGDHMDNLVEIPSGDTQQEMINWILDNGRGGTQEMNNREYGANINDEGILYNKQIGPVGDPSRPDPTGAGASIPAVDFHSHPSGSKIKPDGSIAVYSQPPSTADINTASGQEYVIGMRSGVVYVYNNSGIIATMPKRKWKK